MAKTVCIATVLLSIHYVSSYVLLTANLEDVHAIAKQIVESPVSNQLGKIFRRAFNIFNEHLTQAGEAQRRAQDSGTEGKGYRDHRYRSSDENDNASGSDNMENRAERRSRGDDDDLVALGKNASAYLSSIKQIFENVKL